MNPDFDLYKKDLRESGFVIIENVFSDSEVSSVNNYIESQQGNSANFRKSTDLFAIRKVLKEIPDLKSKIISNARIQFIIQELFGADYFLVKALYFDKPSFSNWFVSYHQDLSISVTKKTDLAGFVNWTVKDTQYGVQPPVAVLENIYTIRIHLDDCDGTNGALHVIPGSHKKGIYRAQEIDWTKESSTICNVRSGGIMIMRPLLLHSSQKSTEDKKRRVLHLEFCNTELPESIHWAEKELIF